MSNSESGFLTKRDKEFLRASGDYYTGENAKNQRYETREVIAERTRQAFHDFAFLYDVLDERERIRIFDVGETPHDDSVHELLDGVVDTIAFLYLSLNGEADHTEGYYRPLGRPFTSVISAGVPKAERRRRPLPSPISMVNVDFSVSVSDAEPADVDRMIDKIAYGKWEDLTGEEAKSLIRLADKTEHHPDLSLEGWDDLREQIAGRRNQSDSNGE